MHLVVYSKGSLTFYTDGMFSTTYTICTDILFENTDSLEKLQNLVESKFEEIRNIDRSRPSFPGSLCSSEHTQVTNGSFTLAILTLLNSFHISCYRSTSSVSNLTHHDHIWCINVKHMNWLVWILFRLLSKQYQLKKVTSWRLYGPLLQAFIATRKGHAGILVILSGMKEMAHCFMSWRHWVGVVRPLHFYVNGFPSVSAKVTLGSSYMKTLIW